MVWVGGIVGMIVSSANGNNNGWVATCGVMTALASLSLLSASAATSRDRVEVFEEADAEALEAQVQAIVAAGGPEADVRRLVRDAIRLGRHRRRSRE